ncbi:MAG TPA: hypothetical protein VF771_03775, partial [Longimicrobiaceae bacterium]
MADHPASFFADPHLGPTQPPESIGDEYIALALRWPKTPAPLYLMLREGRDSLVELGFDPDSGLLCDVTLVAAPPSAWSDAAGPVPELPAAEGLPRCAPAAWMARTRTGALDRFGDRFVDVRARVRVE